MATAIETLKTSVADLGTSISAEIQAVTDKLNAIPAGGTSDAEIADVVASLTSLKEKVDGETAVLAGGAAPSPELA